MKIRSVKLTGHPGLGSMSVSFTDQQNVIYETVVLAGGNGTGKSTMLDCVQRAFEGAMGANIGVIELEIELSTSEIAFLSTVNGNQPPPISSVVTYTVDTSVNNQWTGHILSYSAGNNYPVNVHVSPPSDIWKQFFKSFYSEAAVNFNPGGLAGAGASSLDDQNRHLVRSGEAISGQIAQLIVDIRAADAEELSDWIEKNPGLPPPPTVVDQRFSRFRAAFNYMLPFKRFKGVSRTGGSIQIEFEEFGRVSTIDKLSTGEKQIIFRAGFLLRDLANVADAIVLIDEPELSLHPEWQQRVMSFYKTILSNANGQHPQIILATHSPFIVHGAANSKIIILEKDAVTGAIQIAPKPYYPALSGYEAVRAFNINSFISSTQMPLLVLTEGASDVVLLETAWQKLRGTKAPFFEIRPALGDKNLQITLNDEETLKRVGTRLLAGIFDFDTGYNQWNGIWKKNGIIVGNNEPECLIKKHNSHRAWAILLPVPSSRAIYASSTLKGNSIMSIEFLFDDVNIPPTMIDYRDVAMNGKLPFFKDVAKIPFAQSVANLPNSAFSNFEPLLGRLEDIYNGVI